MPSRLRQTGILCGLVAPLLWVAMIALCGALRPGFDHFDQYISELGERGSGTEILMRYGAFVPTGMLHIGFAGALLAHLRQAAAGPRSAWPARTLATTLAALVALNGIGRIGAGMFACVPGCNAPFDPIQQLHSLSATLAFAAVIAAALLAGFVFRRDPGLRPLSRMSIAAAFAALGFLGLMLHGQDQHVATGLYERLASGVMSLWIFLTAARLWWASRHPIRN
jgi:hypothetical membrane protein